MKCRRCNGTGTAVLQTADGEKEPEQCLCVLEEDYFSFLQRHGIPEAEGEIKMKGYVRFQNGIVSVSQIEGFSWKRLKPGDPLLDLWERQNYTDDVYSVVIFLKGSNKFMTTTTQKNLDQMIARFKIWNNGDENENGIEEREELLL
tara:strand:- start:132 stop:569 length:438 start_codon:yes stop_codon:yes gene_type:complete